MVVRVTVNGDMLQSVAEGLTKICHVLETVARSGTPPSVSFAVSV